MDVDGHMLAAELKRRHFRPRSMLDSLGVVEKSTWVPGELRGVPTPLLVLAAISLTNDRVAPPPAEAVGRVRRP